jgi:hypothetical protein
LDRLSEFCEPVVGLGWDDPELAGELSAQGHEVIQLPAARMSHTYRNHARRLDRIHARRLDSPTTEIRRQRWKRRGMTKARAIDEIRTLADSVSVSLPGRALRIERDTDRIVDAETNLAEFLSTLQDRRVDGVLSFTPYHDQDVLALIAADRAALRTIVSVISFDNPTIRGRLPILPDRVSVWNDGMADQIRRSHPLLDPTRVEVVGAPQFDLHRRADLVMDDQEWRAALGLPATGTIVLYGAGPRRLVPAEHNLVRILDRAITEGRIPGDVHLLVRLHPVDPMEAWAADVSGLRHTTVAAAWAAGEIPMRSWPSRDDLALQMSSLAHAAVHVNVCSSMTVDGAMFDRPQIGPTFVPGATPLQQTFVRRFYDQEHWEPIARSGALVAVDDEAQLIDAVADALARPDRLQHEREHLLAGVLAWPDGHASERLAEVVARTLCVESQEHTR